MEHAKVSQFRSDRNLGKRSFHGDGVPFPVIRSIQLEAEGLVTEIFSMYREICVQRVFLREK